MAFRDSNGMAALLRMAARVAYNGRYVGSSIKLWPREMRNKIICDVVRAAKRGEGIASFCVNGTHLLAILIS
jgi:hypothetical protein